MTVETASNAFITPPRRFPRRSRLRFSSYVGAVLFFSDGPISSIFHSESAATESIGLALYSRPRHRTPPDLPRFSLASRRQGAVAANARARRELHRRRRRPVRDKTLPRSRIVASHGSRSNSAASRARGGQEAGRAVTCARNPRERSPRAERAR